LEVVEVVAAEFLLLVPSPVLGEITVGDDGAQDGFGARVVHLAPVMSIWSLIRNRAAPSMIPVAICQPWARAVA
jgi:hypothetical protein